MIRQKLQLQGSVQHLETVQLDTLVVIDVDPLLLCHCHHSLGVEETQVVDGLHDVGFKVELLGDPVEGSQVALPPSNHQVTAVACVIHSAREEYVDIRDKYVVTLRNAV